MQWHHVHSQSGIKFKLFSLSEYWVAQTFFCNTCDYAASNLHPATVALLLLTHGKHSHYHPPFSIFTSPLPVELDRLDGLDPSIGKVVGDTDWLRLSERLPLSLLSSAAGVCVSTLRVRDRRGTGALWPSGVGPGGCCCKITKYNKNH